MIDTQTLQQYTLETRAHVSSACVVLFETLNNSPVDVFVVENIIKHMNHRGLTPQMIKWYEQSDVSHKSLTQNITDSVSVSAAEPLVEMMKIDDVYWSKYNLLDITTITDLHKHKISYDAAWHVKNTSNSNKIFESIVAAASNCVIEQTQHAYDAFFAEDDETFVSKLETSLDSTQFTHINNIINNGQSSYGCDTITLSQEIIRSDGTGDDSQSETPKQTFSTSSARVIQGPSTNFKHAGPWYQHLNTTTSLDNTLITSNIIETCADTLSHTRFGSIHDQIQTSSDYVDQITHLYTNNSTLTMDMSANDSQLVNKQNDFIRAQLIEDTNAIKNDDNQIELEDIQHVS